MLAKLTKAFCLLRDEVSAIKGDVQRVSRVRQVVQHGKDGKTLRRVINSLQGGRNVGYFVVSDHVHLNQNDYVKLQVANTTSTADVTAELDSFFSVRAR